MDGEYRVQDWQIWMRSFKQQVSISVQSMQNEIDRAETDIRTWDSIKGILEQIYREINALYEQLSACQASPESDPEEQSAVARRRQELYSEIANKEAEKVNQEMKIQSQTERLRQWSRKFGDESYYNDLGLKLRESQGTRAKMVQYQEAVQQAEAIISGATGTGGELRENKYGSHIGSRIAVMKEQITALTTMQRELQRVEKNIIICCRTAIFLNKQIVDRIGDSDAQKSYGSKHL